MMSLLEALSPTARGLLKSRKGIYNSVRKNAWMVIGVVETALRSHDRKLQELTSLAGLLGQFRACDNREGLIQIAALCAGWVQSIAPGVDAFEFIEHERLRQTQLFLDGRHSFNCASPIVDDLRKLRVLIEEIGEVAEAIDHLETAEAQRNGSRKLEHIRSCRSHLCAELTQVAAVAVAWLESLEATR